MFCIRVSKCWLRESSRLWRGLNHNISTRSLFLGLKKKRPRCKNIPVDHRYPSPCITGPIKCITKPCFNIEDVTFEFARSTHQKMIKTFLYTHFWSRDPGCTGLYLPLNCKYVSIMTNKYAMTGDRLLAFEWQGRGNEKRLIGILIANKMYPWEPLELDKWQAFAKEPAERTRMAFITYTTLQPDLFKTYNTEYIYSIDALATVPDVMCNGVATQLLRKAVYHACDVQHYITAFLATSAYGARAAHNAGMKKVWAMDYASFKIPVGGCNFYPRNPHAEAQLFIHERDKRNPLPITY